MRKHISAAQARARAARSCLGIVTGSLVVMGMTACGGGRDNTSPSESIQAQSVTDGAARAQAISTPALGAYIQGTGWSTALPDMPTRTFKKPASITGTTYYIDSVRPYADQQAPRVNEDGLTPATAFTNIGQFKAQIVNNPSKGIKSNDAILLKCGTIFRNENLALTLTGLSNIYIGPYQAGQTGPNDCADGSLPTLRQSKWIGAGWTATDASNTVHKTTITAPITRMFKYTIPLVKARYPNVDSTAKYLLTGGDISKKKFKVSETQRLFFVGKDLVGADVFIKSRAWAIERRTIDAYDSATGVVTLNRDVSQESIPQGAGYYLAGKAWMFDQPGEWYQSGSTAYYRHTSSNATAMTAEHSGLEYTDSGSELGITISNGMDVTISRIAFEHQETTALGIYSSQGVTANGVEVRFASELGIDVGKNGPTGNPSENITIEYSKVRGVWGFGIRAGGVHRATPTSPGYPISKNVALKYNLVTETAMYDAAPKASETQEANGLVAIRLGAPTPVSGEQSIPGLGDLDAQAVGNIVINNAGPGIYLNSGRHGGLIDSNSVINACLRTTDCGAIYANNRDETKTLPAAEGTTSATISNNVVVGVKGDIEGVAFGASSRASREMTYGIYLDDLSANIEVVGNKVTDAAGGIYLHNASWNNVHGNTIQAVTLASIEVSSDWKYPKTPGTFTETVRGNLIHDNVLFSHRTVDPAQFTASYIQQGMQGQDPPKQVYAQLWLHNNAQPSAFFTDDASTGARRNKSHNNQVLTHSKTSGPSTWGMDGSAYVNNQSSQLTTQISGAIWEVQQTTAQTANYRKRMALPEWLKLVQPDAGYQEDSQSSPIVYRPYVLTLGNNGTSLVSAIDQGSQWVWNAASQVPYATGTSTCGGASVCAGVTASATWHSLVSPAFQTTAGNLYFIKYTIKQGAARGEHNTSIRRDSEPNRYAQVGEFLQSVYTEANEVRRFEHFFRANSHSGSSTVIYLKPSDGLMTDPTKTYTTQYFSDASVHQVTGWDVLPSLAQLSATATNASSVARTFRCVEDLGFAQASCSAVRDENNQPVTFPVSVAPRTMKRLYIHSSTWSN